MPRRVQYRHPTTGKIITKAAYDAITSRQRMFAPAPEPSERVEQSSEETPAKPFVPFRIWTAGPGMRRDRIYMGKPGLRLTPARDGAYYITSPEQEEFARKALKGRWWVDTVDPENEDIPRCDICDWRSMSHAAMFQHLNAAHGRPQG